MNVFGSQGVFRYDVVLVTRLGRVLAAFWRIVLAETRRMSNRQKPQQK